MAVRRKMTATDLGQMLGTDPANYAPGEVHVIPGGARITIIPPATETSQDVRVEMWAAVASSPQYAGDPEAYDMAFTEWIATLSSLLRRHQRLIRRERLQATARLIPAWSQANARPHKHFPDDPLAMAKSIVRRLPK